jgi:hypothetical protein
LWIGPSNESSSACPSILTHPEVLNDHTVGDNPLKICMASLVRVPRTEHIRQRDTRPRANEHVARKAEALAAVRDATVARQTTPVIDDPAPYATDPTPQLAATAGKMLIDVWGSLDRLLAEERAPAVDKPKQPQASQTGGRRGGRSFTTASPRAVGRDNQTYDSGPKGTKFGAALFL